MQQKDIDTEQTKLKTDKKNNSQQTKIKHTYIWN